VQENINTSNSEDQFFMGLLSYHLRGNL
jgi:hypothetical protein